MSNIKESDWKVLKSVQPQALERFCQKVLADIASLNTNPGTNFHQKYLAVYSLIEKRDREMSIIFNDLRRTTAIERIIGLRERNLFSPAEYSQFSPELQERIDSIVR
jgi:hypothetical protein